MATVGFTNSGRPTSGEDIARVLRHLRSGRPSRIEAGLTSDSMLWLSWSSPAGSSHIVFEGETPETMRTVDENGYARDTDGELL